MVPPVDYTRNFVSTRFGCNSWQISDFSTGKIHIFVARKIWLEGAFIKQLIYKKDMVFIHVKNSSKFLDSRVSIRRYITLWVLIKSSRVLTLFDISSRLIWWPGIGMERFTALLKVLGDIRVQGRFWTERVILDGLGTRSATVCYKG